MWVRHRLDGRSVVRLTEIPQIRAREGREEREENRPGSFVQREGRVVLYFFLLLPSVPFFFFSLLTSISLRLLWDLLSLKDMSVKGDPDKSGTADLGWIIPTGGGASHFCSISMFLSSEQVFLGA